MVLFDIEAIALCVFVDLHRKLGKKKVNILFFPLNFQAYDLANDVPNLRLDRTRKVDPSEYINMTHPNNHSR